MLRVRHILALLSLMDCGDDDPQLEDASLDKDQPDAAVCRSQCVPFADCEEKPASSFPDYDGTVAEFAQKCSDAGAWPWVVGGTCAGGGRFLILATGKTGSRRYFDSAGKFVSMESLTDFGRSPCGGTSYWPSPRQCDEMTVREKICGQPSWDVGYVVGR